MPGDDLRLHGVNPVGQRADMFEDFGDRSTRLIRQHLVVSLIRPTPELSDPPNAFPRDDAELRQ